MSGLLSNSWRSAFYLLVLLNAVYGTAKLLHKAKSATPRDVSPVYCKETGEAYLALILNANLKMLRSPTDKGGDDGVVTWGIATWGPMTNYAVTRDARLLADVELHVNAFIDNTGKLRLPLERVDNCAMGVTLCTLYEATGKRKYLTAAGTMADFLLARRGKQGLIPYSDLHPRMMLIDTLGMVCEFLTHYGQLTNQEKYVDIASAQILAFSRSAMDDVTGLYFHAYQLDKEGGSGVVGWCRGAGWMLLGLVGTLEHMGSNHRDYNRLSRVLSAKAEALRRYQPNNGCWHWAVNIVGSKTDTSGTAMIAYAIQRAIIAKLLDPSYESVTARALSGIARATKKDGVIVGALQAVNWVGDYPQEYDDSVWAQSTAVGLASLRQYSTLPKTARSQRECPSQAMKEEPFFWSATDRMRTVAVKP